MAMGDRVYPGDGRARGVVEPRIRVAVIDDHAIVREGIRGILDAAAGIEVAFVAGSGEELLAKLSGARVDVCVLDLTLPDVRGLDLLSVLVEEQPDIGVLVFTMHAEDAFGLASLRAGASGFLTKGAPPSELLRAIRYVAERKVYVTPELAALMVRRNDGEQPAHTALSAREWSVFIRIARGMRNGAISKELHLNQRTVSSYRRRVLDKLGASSDADLVLYAVRHRLVGAEMVADAGDGEGA